MFSVVLFIDTCVIYDVLVVIYLIVFNVCKNDVVCKVNYLQCFQNGHWRFGQVVSGQQLHHGCI